RREHPLYRTTINYQTPTNNCDEETYILFNSRHAVFAACPARPGNNHQSRPDVDGSGGIHHGRTRYLVFRFRQRPPTGRWRGSLPVDMGTDQPDRQSDSHRLRWRPDMEYQLYPYRVFRDDGGSALREYRAFLFPPPRSGCYQV